MHTRTVKQIVTGHNAVDGAGVHLVRVLDSATVRAFDPFLMLDAFDSRNPEDYIQGFPMHPHRGIETFTYLIEGEIDHKDSLGHEGRIMNGDCQWMTAGSGILHQEMPQATTRILGLQLWINLPRCRKMTAPKYRDIAKKSVPVQGEEGARIAVIAGAYNGIPGAARGDYVDVSFLDVTLQPDQRWQMGMHPDHTAFAYTISGSCAFEDRGSLLQAKHAVLLADGDTIAARGGPEGVRMVIVSGPPVHEPVAWGGPIVMNTKEELREAFMELESGTFLRHA